MQEAFLVDVDNTLLDTDRLKDRIGQNYMQQQGSNNDLLWQTYAQVSKQKGVVDIQEIASQVARATHTKPTSIENIFLNAPFNECLFEGSLQLLKELKKRGQVIIYSWGDTFYQPIKIEKSGIEEIVGSENVVITADKNEGLKQLVHDLKARNTHSITIIDDKAEVLDAAYALDPNIHRVWIQYGKYKDRLPIHTNNLHQVGSLQEARAFLL